MEWLRDRDRDSDKNDGSGVDRIDGWIDRAVGSCSGVSVYEV